jgi:hypothetical protein
MNTFLNVNLDGRTPARLMIKHLLFSLTWTLFILQILRVDIILFDGYESNLYWLEVALPVLFFALVVLVAATQKWYFNLALLLYPLLAIFWFAPKMVLSTGKIYLFARYIDFIYRFFRNFRSSLIKICLISMTVIFFFVIDSPVVIYFTLMVAGFFYVSFVYDYFRSSFKPPELFGNHMVTYLESLKNAGSKTEHFVFRTLIAEDDKVSKAELRERHLTRLVTMNYLFEQVSKKLNSFSGRRAFAISQVFEIVVFLAFTILFFWFINFQLFSIDPSNFSVVGMPTSFEFLYYTLKTITFGEIEFIKPESFLSRCVEIASFLMLGILFLGFVLSIVASLRNERMKDNIKLTTEVCITQNEVIKEFISKKYETDVKSAFEELKSIRESISRLANIVDKIF